MMWRHARFHENGYEVSSAGDQRFSPLYARLRDGRKIQGIDLWVVPAYNPDGLARGTRRNAHGVDLNRNYPYHWAPLGGLFEVWVAATNRGADGGQILTAEKLPALHAAVMAACADDRGVIEDPRACAFEPASMRCVAGSFDRTSILRGNAIVSASRRACDRQIAMRSHQ